MNAAELLENLQGRGFALSATGGDLFVTPRAALTPVDASAIRANKTDLLILLGVVFSFPYVDSAGDLRIPFDSHPRYRYWAGGQPLVVTLAELDAPVETWRGYIARGLHLLTEKHADVCKGQIKEAGAVWYCAECQYFVETGAVAR